MKINMIIFILLLSISSAFSQEDDEDFSFVTTVTVEKEEPRVSITSSRVRPLFPELPIKKSFVNEILDKYNNNNYVILQRKRLYFANIENELNKLN